MRASNARIAAIKVAMADPLDLQAVDDLQFQTGRRIQPMVASLDSVLDGIERAYGNDLADLVRALPGQLGSAASAEAGAAALEREVRERAVEVHRHEGALDDVVALARGAAFRQSRHLCRHHDRFRPGSGRDHDCPHGHRQYPHHGLVTL